MKREYIVLCGQIVGGDGRPFETIYGFDGARFRSRDQAIQYGFKIRGSDDFNIGVVGSNKLLSLDWMEKPVDTDPTVLSAIAEQIFL